MKEKEQNVEKIVNLIDDKTNQFISILRMHLNNWFHYTDSKAMSIINIRDNRKIVQDGSAEMRGQQRTLIE